MLKGVFVGVGIMIVCFLIPIVHFVTGPFGPFIAGYFGISFAPDRGQHYAVKALKFGSAMGLVWLLVTGTAAVLVVLLVDPAFKIQVLMWIGVAVITLYTGSMASLGAMYAMLRAQQRAAEAE